MLSRLLRDLLLAMVLGPGTLWLALLLVARLADMPRLWWLDLVDTFALYAFAPFFVVVLLAALLRSRPLALLALAAGVLFVGQFGRALLPRSAPARASAPHVSILTYNLRSPNGDPAPLIQVIREHEPDVVVLQELTSRYVERLTAQIGDRYPSFVVAGVESANDGGGIFSRVPIVDHAAFRLADGGNVLQRARLRTDAGDVWLVNVHLASPELEARRTRGGVPIPLDFREARRDEELARLVAEVAALDGPFILAGDFNSAAGSRPNRVFPAAWRDAYREAGEGFGHTYPSGLSLARGRVNVTFPLLRIDYVLTSPDLAPRYATVPRVGGSDHLPVFADVELLPPR